MLAKIKRKWGTTTIWGIILSLIAACFMFPLIQYIQTKQEFHGIVATVQSALKDVTTKITVQTYDDIKSGVINVRTFSGTKSYNIASMVMENLGATETADDQYLLADSGYKFQIVAVNVSHDKNVDIVMKYKITKDKAVLGLMDISATKRAYGILQTKCPHENTLIQDADLLYSGTKVCANCGEVLEKGKYIVPKDGRYVRAIAYTTKNGATYVSQTQVLAAGEEVQTIKACDQLEYNGYYYTYQSVYKRVNISSVNPDLVKQEDITGDGWSVLWSQSTASQPPPIADYIGQKPVTAMYETFAGIYVTEMPEMPDTILSMDRAFSRTPIASITKLPSFVQSLNSTFYGCARLTDCSDLVIPETVTSMGSTFATCSGLKYAPKLPSHVRDISFLFLGCTNLQTAPYVPEGVIDMKYAFYNCTSISAFNIPTTAQDVAATAYGCKRISVYYAGTNFSALASMDPWGSDTTATIYTGYDGAHILG